MATSSTGVHVPPVAAAICARLPRLPLLTVQLDPEPTANVWNVAGVEHGRSSRALPPVVATPSDRKTTMLLGFELCATSSHARWTAASKFVLPFAIAVRRRSSTSGLALPSASVAGPVRPWIPPVTGSTSSIDAVLSKNTVPTSPTVPAAIACWLSARPAAISQSRIVSALPSPFSSPPHPPAVLVLPDVSTT